MPKCNSCSKTLTKKSTILECSRCQKVVHATAICSALSNKQLAALRVAENLEWTCNDCNQNSSRRKSFLTTEEYEDDDEEEVSIVGANIDVKKLLLDVKKEVSTIVTQEMRSVSSSVQFCSQKVDEFAETIDALTGKLKDMERKYAHLDNQNKYLELKVQALEQRCAETEQQLLIDYVEIAGIPDSSDSDLPKLVEKIADKLNTPKEDIVSLKRLGARRNGPAPVLVRVRHETSRQKLMYSARDTVITTKDLVPNLVGEAANEKIFIREALTPFYKNLLWQAKQDLKGVFKYVWFREGKVLVRKNENGKIYKIRTKSDIQSLILTANNN